MASTAFEKDPTIGLEQRHKAAPAYEENGDAGVEELSPRHDHTHRRL